MNIPSMYGNNKISDEEYRSIMEEAYKEPNYLSPHDIDRRLDDEGYVIEEDFRDYVELRQQNIFIGIYPLETILDGIEAQFVDYINIEDNTNYVDIFYTQLESSIQAVMDDENEIHKQELIDYLNDLKYNFVARIEELFEIRLTISITAIDDESTPDVDEVEVVIRKMYEFFILNAKDNFLTVITSDMSLKHLNIIDDVEFFKTVEEMLNSYSPLITCMTPTKFLEYCEEEEILDYYEDGQVSGNFLRKYTPKLYQNEEFKVQLISSITMINDFKKDIVDREGDNNNG